MEETASFVSFDQTVLRHDDGLIGPSTDATVNNLEGSLAPEVITTVLQGLEEPGRVLDQPGQSALLDGEYRFVEYFYELNVDTSRSISTGVLTIDHDEATISSVGTKIVRTSACTGACSADAYSWRCTCTPATATCTPTSR